MIALILLLVVAPDPTKEAEALASSAVRLAGERPEEALAQARKALSLTAEFEPLAFVKAGRKGEVVEDSYLAARTAYRSHRAHLYEAVGRCLGRSGRHKEASRYFARSVALDPRGGAVVPLARSLVALGRAFEALDLLIGSGEESLAPESLAVAEQAADAGGLPSLQSEIDRVRLQHLPKELAIDPRPGPLHPPDRSHLSTGEPFRLDGEGLTLIYVAEASCRSCSADLEVVKRATPPDVHVVMAPANPARDESLRQTLGLYHYRWPVLVGPSISVASGVLPPGILLVGRLGWSGAVVKPPFAASLPQALGVLARKDLQETIPRSGWKGRPAVREPAPPAPKLLAEGLAPGEDEPTPPAFAEALAAYRAGHAAQARHLFEQLEASGDGWLLPPEARLDRALCLAAAGQKEEARRMLLRIGDSRFQEDVDRALERIGSPR